MLEDAMSTSSKQVWESLGHLQSGLGSLVVRTQQKGRHDQWAPSGEKITLDVCALL